MSGREQEPRLYTREEALAELMPQARKLARREQCAGDGHDLERIMLTRNHDGLVCIEVWGCGNCDVDVRLTYPD